MTALKPGVAAPDFTTRALDGSEVRLRDFRGNKVWLAFYRYAGCPICNLFLSQITKKLPVLVEKGLKMVAFFESKPALFPKEFIEEPQPRVIVPDPEKKFYTLYEVETKLGAALHPGVIMQWFEAVGHGFKQPMPDGALGTIPAHFLINEEGIIERVKYGMHIGDHIQIEEVESFVSPIKKQDLSSEF